MVEPIGFAGRLDEVVCVYVRERESQRLLS